MVICAIDFDSMFAFLATSAREMLLKARPKHDPTMDNDDRTSLVI
jgi:hypothetical protein